MTEIDFRANMRRKFIEHRKKVEWLYVERMLYGIPPISSAPGGGTITVCRMSDEVAERLANPPKSKILLDPHKYMEKMQRRIDRKREKNV